MEILISFGLKQINVKIKHEKRKTLGITVYPNLEVYAKVPANCSTEKIKVYLKKKAAWIAKQMDYFEKFHPLPVERKFISGETHYYLGKQYRLRIKKANRAGVRLVGRFFEMELPDPEDSKKAELLMRKWYLMHAKILFTKRVNLYMPFFLKIGAIEPVIRLKRMKKRWGSCCGNTIILNTDLIKAPIYSIDYVIIHELCHLIHSTHNKNFYRLLGQILPDWQERKQRLETVIV